MKYLVLMLLTIISLPAFAQDNENGEERESPLSCTGVERWSLKVLVDAAANTVNYTPLTSTITSLATMTTPTPSTTAPRIAGLEDKTYKVTCNITIKKDEDDNDYHLVLSDGTYTLVGEVPDPYCAPAASSSHVNEYLAARQFIDAHIPSGNVNNVSIPAVVVTGVAFLDPPHGQTGKAPNNIELHPILDIHFAPTSVSSASLNNGVALSPNPFTDHLDVSFSNIGKRVFELYNFQGYRISSQSCDDKIQHLTMPELSSGLYYYRIISNGSVVSSGELQHR